MTDTKYPLCAAAGLKVHDDGAWIAIYASDVEAYLYNEKVRLCSPSPEVNKPPVQKDVEASLKRQNASAFNTADIERPASPWKFEAKDFQSTHRGAMQGCRLEYLQGYADVANAKLAEWLSAAPVVYSYAKDAESWWAKREAVSTHTARLVAIEPIRRDTAESLLREMLLKFGGGCEDVSDLLERAEKLLGQERIHPLEWGEK